jgi:hypothetical protein
MKYFWGIVAIGVYFLAANFLFGYICPVMIIVGLPCPGCGMTRAGLLFLTGNFSQSFSFHPMFVPAMVFMAIAAALKFFRPEKTNVLQTPAIIFFVIIVAVYVFRMVNLFPNQPPMVINYDSILFNIKTYIER